MLRSNLYFKKPRDLDLLPIMNLFSILIPFLITVISFQKLGVVDAHLPETSTTAPSAELSDQDLDLSILISKNAIHLASRHGIQPPIAIENPYYSTFEQLRKDLQMLSARVAGHEDADRITVAADDSVAFDLVIQTMDAARDNGFAKVSLAKVGG